ncbi:MAG: hypothetical protein IJS71_03050 [Clostridia bacterium]|nr:hypothetical protein [Clostridia bacterium]
MISDVRSTLSKYIKSSCVVSVSFERGYGIVPARFELCINKSGKEYRLDIESNIRVLQNGKSILSFDDMFLDRCGHEFSVEEYQSQRGIEKSLLSCTLSNLIDLCIGKRIARVMISKCGDITLLMRPKIEMQIINDSHNVDAVLFRLRDLQKTKIYLTKNGKKEELLSTIFEVRSSTTGDLLVSWKEND